MSKKKKSILARWTKNRLPKNEKNKMEKTLMIEFNHIQPSFENTNEFI